MDQIKSHLKKYGMVYALGVSVAASTYLLSENARLRVTLSAALQFVPTV